MITQKTRKADKSYKPELLQIPAREQSSYSLQDFESETAREWIELSGINPDLYNLNVDCQPDEVTTIFGEFSRPLHEVLNWNIDRWALVENRNYGAIIRSYDGSVFQVKLLRPRTRPDGEKVKTVKYETPLSSSTSLFLAKIDLATWKNICSDGSYQDLPEKATTTQISSAFWEWVKVTKQPVVWCEGAKKTLNLISNGYIAIGLSGVSNGYRSPKDELGNKIGDSFLVPEVAEFATSGRDQIICFDSDTNPKTVAGVNVNIRNFGRLLNEKSKAGNVKVLGWDAGLGKGVDDLIVGNGIDFFADIFKKARSFSDWKKEKDSARSLFHWEQCKQYTPDVSFTAKAISLATIPIPDRNTIVAIKSDYGTQKTRSMLPHLKHWQSQGLGVILAGYRNALLEQTVTVWSEVLSGFMMMKSDPMYIRIAGSHLAACIDQFTRKKVSPHYFDDRVLILDEADAVEIHLLMASTLKENRSEVYSLFCEAVKRAEVIYLMSAGLTDATVKFIADIRGDSQTKIIKYQNHFINPQKFIIVEDKVGEKSITSNRSILRTFAIEFKGRACFVSDSQNELKALELKKKEQGRKTFRYDSETSDSDDGKAFALNPDGYILDNKIDDLFLSPSGNSGLSISIENHFKAVFAFYFGVIDIDSFLQMPMRIRDLNCDRYISCPVSLRTFSGEKDLKNPEEIEKVIHEFTQDVGVLSLQDLPMQDRLYELYKSLSDMALNGLQFKRFAQIQASHNFEKGNLKDRLESRLIQLGHTFKRKEEGYSSSHLIGELIDLKERVKLDDCVSIFESEDITFEYAKDLSQGDCCYEDRLKVQKAMLKETLPKIEVSEIWSPEFIKLQKFDKRDLLKSLDLRFLAANPKIAKLKAVDKTAYLLSQRDVISAQDIKSPLPRLKALKETGLLDLADYEGDDLHKDHSLVLAVCKRAKLKVNSARLGLRQSKDEGNMQFISRLLSTLGKGTGAARYEKETKAYFYSIADKARVTLEQFQFDRAMTAIGLVFSKETLPKKIWSRCFDEDKQVIFSFADYLQDFPNELGEILQLAYKPARNLSQLALIQVQLGLLFDSIDASFLELTESIETRYRFSEKAKKIHDFEQILNDQNSVVKNAETVANTGQNQDHPPLSNVYINTGEGDPDLSGIIKVDPRVNNADKFEVEPMVNTGIIEVEVEALPAIEQPAIEQPPVSPVTPIRIVEGLRIVYQGFDAIVKRVGTATCRIVSESGWDYGYIDLSELADLQVA